LVPGPYPRDNRADPAVFEEYATMNVTVNWSDLWRQFKAFALKGNITDLAMAVIIGAAFSGVINSLVKDVIMPLLSYVVPTLPSNPNDPTQPGYLHWHLGRLLIGRFLGELVNFLAIAVALFLIMVKLLGSIQRAVLPPSPDQPATKECPFCLSLIPSRAVKCAHCTADLGQTISPPPGH
jgi:large conductance mechanosensitive channel